MGDKKNDMDRIGLFQEMGYVTIGDKYKSANQSMILLQVLFLSAGVPLDTSSS